MRLRLSPLLLLPAAAAVVSAYTSQQHTFQSDDEPKDYLSYFKRAALSLSQGKYSSALSDFNKILELKPDFDQARLQRAKILLRDGNLDIALKDTKIVLKHSPKDTAAETLLSSIETTATSIKQAKAAKAAKNYDDCVKHLSIATQGAAALASLRRMRADCNLARGEVEEAAGDLTRAVKLDASVPGPQITLAQLNYFSLYTPETALPHLKQCLRYDPEHRECKDQFKLLKKFATEMEKVENEASAGKWASATGRLLGTGVTGAGTKGLIKEEEETVKKIQERLSLPGKLPRRLATKLHKLACQGFATLKDGEKGHKYCTSALEFDEDDIDALIGLGESQLLLSDYELAVQTLSKAAEMTGHQNHKVQETLSKAQRLLQQSKRKDYYKVLGVDREATQQEIKKAYRKLAVEWHPDKRNADERELAKAKMQEINEANDILSNEDLRRRFDQGEDPNDPHGGHHEGGNPFHAGGFPHAFFQQGGPFGGGAQFKFHFE